MDVTRQEIQGRIAELVGGPGDGERVPVSDVRLTWVIARRVPGGYSREDHAYVLCAFAPRFGTDECWRYVYEPLTRPRQPA